MLTFLSVRRRELLSGVLFRPSVVVLAFAALGLGLPALDHAAATPSAPLVFHGDPAAARSVLSTVATSLITVAGLSFSLMLVTLQLVSSQFTPRAIRGLLADGTHQLTIGTFVGIFVYCLLVTRVVRDESDVTGWSVSVAILLGVAGLGLLVVFIHNLSQSVKVSHIAARTARATLAALDDLYPHPYERMPAEPLPRGKVPYEGTQLRAWGWGYIQTMRVQAIVDAAPRPMHIRARPGDFVTKAAVLVSLDGDSTPRGLEATVRHAVHIARSARSSRTPGMECGCWRISRCGRSLRGSTTRRPR